MTQEGIDYRRSEFRRRDGSTRIRFLWDQTLVPQTAGEGEEDGGRRPPEGFQMGVEFSSEQIDSALAAGDPQQQSQIVPSTDSSGHGTAVAGIAAGSSEAYQGVAVQADLLIVKLGLPDASSFPRTTEVMRGVTYAVRRAIELQMPVVINLSFGNTYGAHDGSSLLERFLDNACVIISIREKFRKKMRESEKKNFRFLYQYLLQIFSIKKENCVEKENRT